MISLNKVKALSRSIKKIQCKMLQCYQNLTVMDLHIAVRSLFLSFDGNVLTL